MRPLIKFFLITTLLLSCATRKTNNKLSDIQKLGQKPTWFIDSVETDFGSIKTIDPKNISNISVLLPKNAKKKLGSKAMDGAIYVTTEKAAKLKYWIFFSSKSIAYKQAIQNYRADTVVAYYINGNPLPDSAIGTLYLIDKKNLKSLQFITVDSAHNPLLIYKHKKKFILNIKAKRPKGLINETVWK